MEVTYSIENFENKGIVQEISSPRTLEACLRLGLDPSDLMPKNKRHFYTKDLTKEMIDIKYEHYEMKRQEKIAAVKSERQSIIRYMEKNGIQSTSFLSSNNTIDLNKSNKQNAMEKANILLELEEKRLEILKRKQNKEIQKIIEKEENLVQLQLKIKKKEEEDLLNKKLYDKKVQLAKQENEKKYLKHLNDIKKLEDLDNIKRINMIKKENEFNKKMALIKQQEDKKNIQLAKERDRNRLLVIEENKKKTDELINLQLEKLEKSRQIMLEKEKFVTTQLEKKKLSKSEELTKRRNEAAKRIFQALKTHHDLQVNKKLQFDIKQKELADKIKEKEQINEQLLASHLVEKEKKERNRINRLVDSYKQRKQYRNTLSKRIQDKDEGFDRIQKERDVKVSMLKFQTTLKMEDKIDNVERINRQKEYQRLQLLKHLEDNDLKYENMLSEKEKMLQRHEDELKEALIRKHEITNTMELMRVTNDYTLLDKLFQQTMNNKSNTKKHYDDEEDNHKTNN